MASSCNVSLNSLTSIISSFINVVLWLPLLKHLPPPRYSFRGHLLQKKPFRSSKPSFTSAPIFQVPDQHQFIVEVDLGSLVPSGSYGSETPIMCLILLSPISNRKQCWWLQSETVNREQWRYHLRSGGTGWRGSKILFWISQKNMECI